MADLENMGAPGAPRTPRRPGRSGAAGASLGKAIRVTGPDIEPAGAADAPGVIALIGRVFDEYGFVFEPAVEVPDLAAFDRHYAPPHGAFWVVRAGEVVVGSVGVERVDGSTAELHRLYVEPDHRRRGLGRALVEAVLAWCRTAGVTDLSLWSDTRFDRAHALYESMGFRRTGERVLAGDLNDTREYRYDRPVSLS